MELRRSSRDVVTAYVVANDGVGALLSVGGDVAVREVVSFQALVSPYVEAVEQGKGKAWGAANVDLVGGEAGRGGDGVVVGRLHVGELHVPVGLGLVDGDGKLLSHGVVDTFGAAVFFGMIGAGVELFDAEAPVDGVGKLGAEVLAVVGEQEHRASPERDVHVDDDVGGAFGGVLGRGDNEHVCSPAQAVGEEEDVAVPTGVQGKWSEVVVADRDSRAVWQS